jgi:hypothetical protein
MPAKLRAIGICETGLNWKAGGRKFVTAFGLYKPNYERARRSLGLPEWFNATPTEQIRAALWHKAWVERTYKINGWLSWGCG